MPSKQEILTEVRDSIKKLKQLKGDLNYDFISSFYKLLRNLLKKEEYKDVSEELNEYLNELKLYRFRALDYDKFYDFFTKGFELLLKQGINADFIIDGIKFFNYQFWDLDSYRLSREKILNAIYHNKELLTRENIIYDNGKEEVGSVQNWFKHYQINFDHNKEARLSLLEYIDKNKAVSRLTADEKLALRNLIYVIEYLRLPAEEVLLDEETIFIKDSDGSYVLIDDGDVSVYLPDSEFLKDFEEYGGSLKLSSQKTVSSPSVERSSAPSTELDLKQLIQLPESDLLQLKFVTQKYKTLNNEEVINYFWEGVESYNLDMVLGAVQELITRQQWDDFVTLPRLKLLIKDFNSRRQLVPNMEEPRAQLRLFFEWLLEEHFGLTDEKTKKWALYFSNLLLKKNYAQYKNLLVFDKQAQKLKWFET